MWELDEYGSGQLVALEHRSEAGTVLALAHCGAVMGGSVPCEISNPPPSSTEGIRRWQLVCHMIIKSVYLTHIYKNHY